MRKGREDKRGKSASAHRVTTGDTVVHGLTTMARVAGNTPHTDEWIIDSGATHHISPNLTDFHEYHPLKELLQVESADCVSLATATGSINLQLEYGMLLRVEALYVPDFGASLLSVHQLIKDGIDVSFRSHSRTAYIKSEGFTEQPVGRCAPGSMSFVLLGNVTSGTSGVNTIAYRANVPPHNWIRTRHVDQQATMISKPGTDVLAISTSVTSKSYCLRGHILRRKPNSQHVISASKQRLRRSFKGRFQLGEKLSHWN